MATSLGLPQRANRRVRGFSLGMTSDALLDVVPRLRAGLSYSALERFSRWIALPLAIVARAAGIPPRTLARRKARTRLTSAESERLLRLAGAVESAVALYDGDCSAARHWLTRPARALANTAPLDLLGSDAGVREVERLIGRLEHGVFS